jgi:hypothetical protein
MAEAQAKTVRVVLEPPAGAVVTADGQEVTLFADHVVDLSPGKHTIQVRHGARTATASIDAKAGELLHPELHFEEPAPPPTHAPDPLPPPIATQTAAPSVETPPPSSSARWITAGAVGAVGVAGLVAGGVFLANAAGQNDTIASASAQAGSCSQPPNTPQCTKLHDALTTKDNDSNIGTGLVIGGGVLVAGAVVTALVWPKSHDPARPSVAPVALPHGAAMLWTGSF